MGTDGSVAYLFNKLGVINVPCSFDEEIVMEIVLEAGADDFNLIDNSYEILTTPSNLSEIIEALNSKGIEMLNAESTMRAEILVKLDQDSLEKVLKIMNFLDDLDDVQEVHTNAAFPDNFNKEE